MSGWRKRQIAEEVFGPSPQELQEMEKDFEERDRLIIETTETLRQLRSGEIVIIPNDIEHARAMFKVACFYLSQHDKDFGLKSDFF
jgi:hypothetical protein